MSYNTREEWYVAAAIELHQLFTRAGYELPEFRIGCGWPTGNRTKRIGQCFSREDSEDKTYEIFISPKIHEPVIVLAVIAHELCHAIAGIKAAHKKPFIEVMKAVGMVPKWTECNPSEELQEKLERINQKLGPYPHAALAIKKRAGKQTTRLLKVQCPECGYVARVTRKWLDEVGAPLCPVHKVVFQEEKKND